MPNSGLFITLSDNDTLNLYLEKGVYGELRPPVFGEVDSRSMHYAALSDAACAREGTHVFFFVERQIVYGGQILGSENYGSYFFNGPYSPMGRRVNADIYWDESSRGRYEATEQQGIFKDRTNGSREDKCQPYIIRYSDELGLSGNSIESDVLYTELSFLPFPVPSNSIQRMSFCTLTPGETDMLIELLQTSSENVRATPRDDINVVGDPMLFNPEMGISHLSQATSKYHHDASIFSNPSLLPRELRPNGAIICRKIPITPFKPYQMDRADMCYFTDEAIENGYIPNKVIELEWKKAGDKKLLKIVRYKKWLRRLIPEQYRDISFYLFAPDFSRNILDRVPREFRTEIELLRWEA